MQNIEERRKSPVTSRLGFQVAATLCAFALIGSFGMIIVSAIVMGAGVTYREGKKCYPAPLLASHRFWMRTTVWIAALTLFVIEIGRRVIGFRTTSPLLAPHLGFDALAAFFFALAYWKNGIRLSESGKEFMHHLFGLLAWSLFLFSFFSGFVILFTPAR